MPRTIEIMLLGMRCRLYSSMWFGAWADMEDYEWHVGVSLQVPHTVLQSVHIKAVEHHT